MIRIARLFPLFAVSASLFALSSPSFAYDPYSPYGGGMYTPVLSPVMSPVMPPGMPPGMYNGGVSTFVSPYTQSIDAHKANLQMRLNQILPTGRINPEEAQRLVRDLSNVNYKEMSYLNNGRGTLSTFQRLRLEGDLDGIDARLTRDTYPRY